MKLMGQPIWREVLGVVVLVLLMILASLWLV
jgi:hypothetical protein